jgi:metal-responsive CopG/Arc/MetJ family transcriptional regulator
MGMNLRLPDELANRLRSLAQDTGRSQQALIREAIELYLRDYKVQAYPPEIRYAITPATTTYAAALEEVKAMGYLETLTNKESMLATLQELREDHV